MNPELDLKAIPSLQDLVQELQRRRTAMAKDNGRLLCEAFAETSSFIGHMPSGKIFLPLAAPIIRPCIYVLAGTNGAGKSSIFGQYLLSRQSDYINPDTLTSQIISLDSQLESVANSIAWNANREFLEDSIDKHQSYAFETTLGGTSIAKLLFRALENDMELRVWYMGLESVQMHIDRVALRVSKGGHDIPQEKILERFDRSRANLMHLIPFLTGLYIYDNSQESTNPSPVLQLSINNGEVLFEANDSYGN